MLQPLQIIPGDETDVDRCKTADERREEIAIMREIELRWARKSAIALAVLIGAIAITCVIVFVVLPRANMAGGTIDIRAQLAAPKTV